MAAMAHNASNARRDSGLRDTIGEMKGQITDLIEAQQETSLAVGRVEGKIMARSEIEQLIGTRVSIEMFTGTINLLDLRIKRVEQGPAGFRSWVIIGIAIFSALISGCSLLVIAAQFVGTHWR